MNSYSRQLSRLKEEGNFRTIPEAGAADVTDFSTNDYLGLGARMDLRDEFMADSVRSSASLTSSASRLLAADQMSYTRFENYLRKLYGREALLFNSGYHANAGLIPALTSGARTLIVADKLVHASIIDGIMLSKADFRRFRHNDTAHLRRILDAEAGKYERVIIVAESIYSMDGDAAPLEELADIRLSRDNTLLYIDEAHALGVCGPRGLGLCAALPEEKRRGVDVMIGTLGKACASSGAFAIMPEELRHVAVNSARSFIFSTALPQICCEWSMFMMQHIESMDSEREHLQSLARQLHKGLSLLTGNSLPTPSHIQPFIVGSASRAVELSQRLLAHGVKVLPIRTPTVPPGTERLRISLSAALTAADVQLLINSLKHELPNS